MTACVSVSLSLATRTTTSPFSVNLIALPIRLVMTCLQAAGIAPQAPRQVRGKLAGQLDALVPGAFGEHVERPLHRLDEVEVERVERQLAGLDLREVEDVVDDRQQRVGRIADRLGELALVGVSSVSSSRPVMPITPFIGVRISWLMFARNSLFAPRGLQRASRARASSNSVSFRRVMSLVTPSVPMISPDSLRTGILVVRPHETVPSIFVSFSERLMTGSPVFDDMLFGLERGPCMLLRKNIEIRLAQYR